MCPFLLDKFVIFNYITYVEKRVKRKGLHYEQRLFKNGQKVRKSRSSCFQQA